MSHSYSIIRGEEYRHLSNLELDGKILDVGGSKKSGYHELISGKHEFIVVNIDESCSPDMIFDVEKSFPLNDESFDNSICLNVLEHVFEFENTFKEQVRCVKKGGRIVIAAPFMHFIHGSPDDYLRYTESSYRRLSSKYNLEIEVISPLGFGLFSLIYQFTAGVFPGFVRSVYRNIVLLLDKTLNKLSKKYRRLSSKIPLGYFVIFVKK